MLGGLNGKQCGPGAVCSGSTLFAWMLKFTSYVRQLFAADDFNRRHFQMHLSWRLMAKYSAVSTPSRICPCIVYGTVICFLLLLICIVWHFCGWNSISLLPVSRGHQGLSAACEHHPRSWYAGTTKHTIINKMTSHRFWRYALRDAVYVQ